MAALLAQPRVMLAAPHKSSGKTTISLGLCAALHRRGLRVQPFKKGPDYIDPMWLAQAAGLPCYNLDFHTQSPSEIQTLFSQHAALAEISLIEGNMGLFDSLDVAGTQSNAALAIALQIPVVLVLDVRGATRSLVPLIQGFMQFEPRLRIAGLILNKVAGARHEQRLREVITQYCTIPILGCVHREAALAIDERHLGLIPSSESQHSDALLHTISQRIAAQIDLDQLLAIAQTAPPLPTVATAPAPAEYAPLRIAIAQDAAFGFYYPDDLEAMRAQGVELIPIDTLHDQSLPESIDALFIGGGFPETQMTALEANSPMRMAIREAIEQGLPTYAECGGLMYLCRQLRWGDKQSEMVGVIPADCVLHHKPIGRGYALIQKTAAHPWPTVHEHDQGVRHVHEFHYSSLENLDTGLHYAYELERGVGITAKRDGIVYKNLLASYVHQRQVQGNPWIAEFLSFVRRHQLAGLNAGYLPPFM
ncbi:MAG: cobyrinate a,c-diamide synthase [Gammaproteobacteria bacterium]|nr:cobyrinate a,c-diamide synthase [Gammaproteobacteria bacterium]